MARFCTKCGTALGDDVRFCLQCGMPVAAPPAAPPPPAAQGPAPGPPAGVQAAGAAPGPAPAKSGNTALKIIVGLLAFFALVTILGIGSCFYIGYRVRRGAKALSEAFPQSATSGRAVTPRDVCSLITKEEVGETLGTTVSEASVGTSSCRYTAASGIQALDISVTWQGAALALKFSRMALKGTAGGEEFFQPVAGIGDEAYIAPMGTTLMFRKGDVLVNIQFHMVGNNVDAAKAIAQKIAARLP